MNILIVGGGKLVYFLSRSFISKGYKVTIINKDKEECSWLARRLKAIIVHAIGSDLQVLEEAGAENADAVLAVTSNDQDNLVICQLAAQRFNIPHTLALVNDPDNEEVFRALNITTVFSTTRILSSLIEQKTDFEEITNLIPVGEGKVNVTELILKKDSPVAGKRLSDVALPDNSLVAVVLRKGQPIVPRGSTELKAGDRLILMTISETYGQVLKALTGKTKR